MSLTDEIIQRYRDSQASRMAKEAALDTRPIGTLADVGFQSNAGSHIGMLNQGIGNLVSLANVGSTREENQRQAAIAQEAQAYQREKDIAADMFKSMTADIDARNAAVNERNATTQEGEAKTSAYRAQQAGRANDIAQAAYDLDVLKINEQNRILSAVDNISSQMTAELAKNREANREILKDIPDENIILDENNNVVGFSGKYKDKFEKIKGEAANPLSVKGEKYSKQIDALLNSQAPGVVHMGRKQLEDMIYGAAEYKDSMTTANTASQQAVLNDKIAEGDLVDKDRMLEAEQRHFLKINEPREAYEQGNKGSFGDMQTAFVGGMSPEQIGEYLQGKSKGRPQYGTAVDSMTREQVSQAMEGDYTFPSKFRAFQAQNQSFEQNSAPFQNLEKSFGDKVAGLTETLSKEDLANAKQIAESANSNGAKWVQKYNKEYGTKFEINDPYVQSAIWNAIQQGDGIDTGLWFMRDARIGELDFKVVAENLRKLEGFKSLKNVQADIAKDRITRNSAITAIHVGKTTGLVNKVE